MRIGILTQPLHTNYGGILQAYALQIILKKMGHEVVTINRVHKNKSIPFIIKVISILKRLLLRFLFGRKVTIRAWETKKQTKTIRHHTNLFIKNNIHLTNEIDSHKKLINLDRKYKFDAYIVGSDQVWRPKYSPCLSNFFFDFLEDNKVKKRIAFAASFGVDVWEYSRNETLKCSELAKKLDAVSVREKSAIDLCRENLGIEAIQILDPTMLLEKEDYIKLAQKDKLPNNNGKIMTYILDKDKEKNKIIEKISTELNMESFSVMPLNKIHEVNYRNIDKCIYPPVSEWLKGFIDAEYIITDSYHGTVFSIIFNKPFITIGNTERGMTRFSTLLELTGLENRLIKSINELTIEKINSSINYNEVNQILSKNKQIALSFVSNALYS